MSEINRLKQLNREISTLKREVQTDKTHIIIGGGLGVLLGAAGAITASVFEQFDTTAIGLVVASIPFDIFGIMNAIQYAKDKQMLVKKQQAKRELLESATF